MNAERRLAFFTAVNINGRQINVAEALYLRALLGSVLPGRWWLDGATGYFGLEGNPIPVGNLLAVARSFEETKGPPLGAQQPLG